MCFSARSAHPGNEVTPSLSRGGRGGGGMFSYTDTGVMGAAPGPGRRPLGSPLLTGKSPAVGCLAARGACERRSGFIESGDGWPRRSSDGSGEMLEDSARIRPRGNPLEVGKSPSICGRERRGLCDRRSGFNVGGGVSSSLREEEEDMVVCGLTILAVFTLEAGGGGARRDVGVSGHSVSESTRGR